MIDAIRAVGEETIAIAIDAPNSGCSFDVFVGLVLSDRVVLTLMYSMLRDFR